MHENNVPVFLSGKKHRDSGFPSQSLFRDTFLSSFREFFGKDGIYAKQGVAMHIYKQRGAIRGNEAPLFDEIIAPRPTTSLPVVQTPSRLN